ncbi:MAG: protein kinase domain-containing protein [Pyrinomonadaceae bacterium]
MNREEYQQVKKIFQSALDVEPYARAEYLDEICSGKLDIRREVERLLVSFESDFLEQPAVEHVAKNVVSESNIVIGQDIGRYTIVKQIGAGGMGEVFLAEDAELERSVAIKVLTAEVAKDTVRISRFIQEAKSASALNHPNILTIYEIGEFEGSRFMATEYVDGLTLGAFLRTEKPNLDKILKTSVQIVSALEAAHASGIVHRDIKPDNIMIRRDGIVKVLDFGLAKLVERKVRSRSLQTGENDPTAIQFPDIPLVSSQQQTSPGMIMGTPHYMSPEQARGKDIDRQTDIFSFGVVLYEMLSGQLPFEGETPSDIIAAILTQEPTLVHELNADLPSELSDIVGTALKKKKQDRYVSTRDLLDDLEQVQRRLAFEKQFGESSSEAFISERAMLQGDVTRTTNDETPYEGKTTNNTAEIFAVPNNLSGELLPLIGRETELEQIAETVRHSETRLLTLTGVGGTGKTRLAKEIALKSLTSFTEGVYFVDLSAIADSELVEHEIAHALGVKETNDDSLVNFLRKKEVLLVLDNFEQITGAASKIGQLLAATLKLKILITSRVRLNLSFEREFTLQPLELPANDDGELSRNAAVSLFVERAKAVKNGFALTDENSKAIADICRRLDGLPLAIELAAVQVKMFAPKAIKKRLESSFNILTSGARDMPERQRTMLDAIAWSYDLLEDDEKKLFNRVFVFRGGFTLDSAEAIGNVDGKLNIFDCLASLIDKSLLVQNEQTDGEPRFTMLQVVREFAREEPEKTGEETDIRQNHAKFFADFAECAMEGFRGNDAVEFLEKTETEHDNLRLALEWALVEDHEISLRIAGALPQFWIRRGHLTEGAKWLRDVLKNCGDDADPRLRARALCGLGNLSWNQGNVTEAERSFEKSLTLAREISDEQMIAIALDGFGIVRMMQGEFSVAQGMFEEGFAIASAIDDRYEIARLANCLGEIFRTQKDYESARPYYEQALSISRAESFKHLIQLTTVNLSAVACFSEDYGSAREYAVETLKLAEEASDKMVTGFALEIFLALAIADGKAVKAASLFGALDKIYESIGYKIDGTDADFLNFYLDKVRAAISEKEFDRAKTKGRAMTMKKAVELALETK